MGRRTPSGTTGGLGPMPPAETPEANSPAGVAPTPRPSTAWRVVSVEPLPGMCLRVKFIDGTSGEVRLQRFLESPQVNRSEEHTSELQSQSHLVCRLLLEQHKINSVL